MRALGFITLAVLLAGCSLTGNGGGSVEPDQLEKLVLQQEDLSAEFLRFDEGRQISADSPGGSRSDPARFGRTEGWKARYRRSGTAETPGPLVIESRADLFESADGARDELDVAGEDLTGGDLAWQRIDNPGIGDESFAVTLLQSSESAGVRFYQVFWRDDNVTASVNANGFEPRLALAEVLALARKQQRRIARAVDS